MNGWLEMMDKTEIMDKTGKYQYISAFVELSIITLLLSLGYAVNGYEGLIAVAIGFIIGLLLAHIRLQM